ncbi:hypothetical protein OG598_26170 [Micromonospora sp. NBC_00330]|nr:hypothetical protein [Micromonospora sp. NBC_00330]
MINKRGADPGDKTATRLVTVLAAVDRSGRQVRLVSGSVTVYELR